MAEKKQGAEVNDTLESQAEQAENQAESTQNSPETSETDARIQELQQLLDESRNKYLYLSADFDNYKRYAARERMDLVQTAGRDIMAALLPILDDFDRAAKNDGLTEGMALIHHKLVATLRNRGLTVLDTKPGDAFNPDSHEAVAEIPAPTEALRGKIVDVLEPGYQLGERIIRFAKVVVGK